MKLLEILIGERIHKKLKQLNQKLDTIMATQKQLADQVNAVNAQLGKIAAESAQTLAKVTELQAVIDNQDGVSAELQAAVDSLAAQVKIVDDLVPDVSSGSGGVSTGSAAGDITVPPADGVVP